MKISLLILIFFLTACSTIKLDFLKADDHDDEISLDGYVELEDSDYIDHIKSFEKIYKTELKNKIVKIPKRTERYLSRLITHIINKNELFFKSNYKPKFYFVASKSSFHFSLPGRKFFISTSLIQKYIKNEAILNCLLIYELIRSEKKIYPKRIIFPTKTLPTNRMLSLMRVSTKDKVEIHKWSYYLLKRASLDTDSYLAWLQIKNRNSLDFAIQLGDIQTISREEALFKAFVIDNEKGKKLSRFRGSSKDFYAFLNVVKR